MIDDEIESETEDKGAISQKEIDRIARQKIAEHYRKLRTQKDLEYLPKDFSDRILSEYSDEITEAKEHTLPKFRWTATSVRQLKAIAAYIFTKDFWPNMGMSGVVVAGFGAADNVPVIKSFSTHRIVLNHLIYREDQSADADEFGVPSPAAIFPFAQRDVVDSFLAGIDPHFQNLIRRYFSRFMNQWPKVVSSNLPSIDDDKRKEVFNKLKAVSDEAMENFDESLQKHVRQKHIDPLLEVVSVLPRDELAAMAEALVNLTSIKRKMSLDVETVGGPIDVAVISKGDGFVWIKRKHYFKPELNHHFFANYFRTGSI